MAEAEWGFAPQLRDDVERIARERGYRLRRLVFDDPEHLSPLVAELYRTRWRARGLPAGRLLVESFVLMAPWFALRSGSVPFWLTFNTEPSAAWLERYLDRAEPYDEIAMMLFAHGAQSIGLAPIERWRRLLARARRHGYSSASTRPTTPAISRPSPATTRPCPRCRRRSSRGP
jgi:hypothetical protein